MLLLVLWEDDGKTMKQIGAQFNLGTGTLTPMIKRLEKNGWIVKKKNPNDERKVLIYLSEKGRTHKEDITAAIAKHIQACQIHYEEYVTIMTKLKQLREKLSSSEE
ncbi:MarR family transcriptional regulator [Bacillaceae bacterium YX66]